MRDHHQFIEKSQLQNLKCALVATEMLNEFFYKNSFRKTGVPFKTSVDSSNTDSSSWFIRSQMITGQCHVLLLTTMTWNMQCSAPVIVI